PSISSDGRFVAFESTATNLIVSDTNGAVRDVFVHDRDSDGDGVFDEVGAISTVVISVSSGGVQGDNASSAPSISADGGSVAFESTATNLVADDTNGLVKDIFVRDLDAGTTARVSVSFNGDPVDGASSAPSMSRDGRYVAFESLATNLAAGDTRGLQDIFIHDRDADGNAVFDETGDGKTATIRVSVDSNGNEASGGEASAPSISADGRSAAFESTATNLVADDTNGLRDVFIHDRDADGNGVFDETGNISTTRVSVSSAGSQGDNSSSAPAVSLDGQHIAFASVAANLVADDTNGVQDIFAHAP
ncbi:MAG: hypothetical protein C4526_12460, partial [Nitrospiraceae bacterium]